MDIKIRSERISDYNSIFPPMFDVDDGRTD